MTTLTLGVASLDDVKVRTAAAFRGEAQGAHVSFASAELLWKVLTAKRWEIVRALSGQGALSIREVARRVGRDVKAVHGDVQALVAAVWSIAAVAASPFPMIPSMSISC